MVILASFLQVVLQVVTLTHRIMRDVKVVLKECPDCVDKIPVYCTEDKVHFFGVHFRRET